MSITYSRLSINHIKFKCLNRLNSSSVSQLLLDESLHVPQGTEAPGRRCRRYQVILTLQEKSNGQRACVPLSIGCAAVRRTEGPRPTKQKSKTRKKRRSGRNRSRNKTARKERCWKPKERVRENERACVCIAQLSSFLVSIFHRGIIMEMVLTVMGAYGGLAKRRLPCTIFVPSPTSFGETRRESARETKSFLLRWFYHRNSEENWNGESRNKTISL